jgi:hypothetical protein
MDERIYGASPLLSLRMIMQVDDYRLRARLFDEWERSRAHTLSQRYTVDKKLFLDAACGAADLIRTHEEAMERAMGRELITRAHTVKVEEPGYVAPEKFDVLAIYKTITVLS